MKFTMPDAVLYPLEGLSPEDALAKTTHMAVAAHQDDIEIMAFEGVMACFQQPDKWFTGVVVTNGAGSPRDGVYARYTNEEMIAVRRQEQKKAAIVGEYAAQALLDLPSGAIKDAANTGPVDDLEALLRAAQPEVVYTHNFADKHDTHVGVALKLVAAIRRLPKNLRPKKLYGCEVWRDLDWMTDADKVAFDTSAHENLQAALLGVFDSQIAGGKRYDLATLGRRRAHATYHASHGVDATTGTNFAMDLTPLVEDDALAPLELAVAHIERFRREIEDRFARLGG